mmetsp:Transcript_23468/g.57493  ORF Transcript_23468/g.57493 Transcript_23468/m.57493 type:complete len:321 (+) Transcript_23468:319-1281(+)
MMSALLVVLLWVVGRLQLAHGGLARDEHAPREDPLVPLDVGALGEGRHPVVQVRVGDALGVHLRAVVLNLAEHVAEVALEVVAAVPPGDVLEPRLLDEVDVHGRAPHEGGGVAVREALERLLVRAVRAHDVGEHEHAARLEHAHELGEQRQLVAGVAQHLAGPDGVELPRPLGRQRVVDVAHLGVHQVVDAQLLAPLHVQRVLPRPDVVPRHLAPEPLRHGVGPAAVAGAQVQHVLPRLHRVGPVHLRHHPVRGGGRGLLHAVLGVLVDAEVDVVSAAAHHALVEDARLLLIVLLQHLVRDLLLGELLVDEVSHVDRFVC